MKKISTLLLAGCLCWGGPATAQDSVQSKPQVKLSLNYNSNLNYFGRTDSLRSSGVFPMAELWITPKFYVNAAPIFVNNPMAEMEYAGTVASVGYQHLTKKWLTAVSLLKPFYRESSELVQSALKAQANTSVTYLNKVVNLTAGADIKFSNQTDFGATAGLDHIVRIENRNGSVLVLDPSVYAYAGTQQFSRTYTEKKSGFALFPGSSRQVTENVREFHILAYEVSMPVIYAKGKLQLMANPSFIMPRNLLTVEDRPNLSERGENTFYTTLSAKITL